MYNFGNISQMLGYATDRVFNIFSIISVVYVSLFTYIGFTVFKLK